MNLSQNSSFKKILYKNNPTTLYRYKEQSDKGCQNSTHSLFSNAPEFEVSADHERVHKIKQESSKTLDKIGPKKTTKVGDEDGAMEICRTEEDSRNEPDATIGFKT